ncbi:hypothetical protein EV178_002295 [Coemansia sp. RSA 1646]|nr:hypothetical protein EV178_002295 [Coemansia sp. RSA 1646]
MDQFISTLKPQTIYLDGYDNGSSILNIPFYFWYERTVPSDVLETALYRTLEEFPVLAGRIKTGNDSRSFVVVDKNSLNMPVYTDSSCNVHFQTLKDADFDVRLLPVDYSSACKTPAPPGIIGQCLKLAEFHVLRMKDDSGIPKILAAVACNIRRAVDGLDERYCKQIGHLINKNPSGHVYANMQVTTVNNAFVVTNHTRFGYYDSDFGSGLPVLVRPAFLVFENDFVIMPARPGQDGYELAFTVVPKVVKNMMESEYWKYIY